VASARVRGIYSTALTKLLLDQGFGISEPSEAVACRFGIERGSREYDIEIFDRRDKQGVLALGTPRSVQAFRAVLIKNLLDLVVRSPRGSIRRAHKFSLDFEFPGYSKSQLDEIRRSVTPTIRGHHLYKACGGVVSSAVDMAENLLVKGRPSDEVEELFRRTITPCFPFEGSRIEIDHIKLNDPSFRLGWARVERLEEDKGLIRVRRRLIGRGLYDGLKMEKRPGDYAITEARLGEWYLITRYFSRGGHLRGTYVNLNTPIELYPNNLRYVDLEVDICIWPDGEMRVLDMKLLEEAVIQGLVETRLLRFIRRKVGELMRRLRYLPTDPHQPVL